MKKFPSLEPAVFPVSARGCWLSLAVRDDRHPEHHRPMGTGLYLRNHHGFQLNAREIARLDLLRNGRKAACRYRVGPGRLELRPRKGAGKVEILLLPPGNLRIRASRGLGLQIAVRPRPGHVAYTLGDSLCALNIRAARMRLQAECLEGSQILDAPWREDICERIRLKLLAGKAGSGEWALDAYTSTWDPPARLPFGKEKAALEASFNSFADAQLAVPPGLARTRELAALVNWSCLVSPSGKFGREAMLMSKGWMDQVWSWDNCFNAMALAGGMPDLAMDQLMLVVDRQDAHGVYPDACNDVHEHYCFNKPPVWGIALREMRLCNARRYSPRRLRPVYESVLRFTDWWLENRRLPGRRLCYYLHGNDSGWDNSTQFDHGVPLEAPDLNAFLVVQAEVLAELAGALGEKKTATRLLEIADELASALLEELWDGDRFVGIRHGQRIRSESLIPCMPLILGNRLPGAVKGQVVANVKRHLTKWGPATEWPGSPLYSPDGYWRGPIWGPGTVLICLGLEACGEQDLAREVAQRFCKLCKASGFAENFDALTGAPLRDPAYSWTASAFLFLAARTRHG